MLKNAIEPAAPTTGRLTRSELFDELAKMGKRSSLPAAKSEGVPAVRGNRALRERFPRFPTPARSPATEIPVEA
jgi:hypothetical protein